MDADSPRSTQSGLGETSAPSFLGGIKRAAFVAFGSVVTGIISLGLAASVGRAARILFNLQIGAITAAVVFFGSVVAVAVVAVRRFGTASQADAIKSTLSARDPLLARVETLAVQLADASRLFAEIRAEMDVRVTTIEALRTQAEHYEKLAALNRDQAEAVQRLVEVTISQGNVEVGRNSLRQQWGFWLGAAVLSVPLGIAVNWLFDFIFKT